MTAAFLIPLLFSAFSFLMIPDAGEAEKEPVNPYADKAIALSVFAASHHYNIQYFILIDIRRPSGTARAVLYNLQKNVIEDSGLVTHGRCNELWLTGRRYSNEIGCGCTSFGKYKIGIRYRGKYGVAFRLHGLDSSNSNAFKRNIVLHSHSCVPERPVAAEICQSDGCPTLAPQFFKRIHSRISNSKRPMLLLIFDSKYQ